MRGKEHYPYVVTDDDNGALIASVQIKSLDWSIPKAEIGYYIDAAYEGKGIVKYPPEIRKLIYTTNTIEGYHRQLRKVTKTKGCLQIIWPC